MESDEMQKQITKLEKDVERLAEQKAKLSADLQALDAEETELVKTLGEAVLDGGNVSALETKLSKMDAKKRAVSAAVHQATVNLTKLESELQEKRKAQISQEVDTVIEQVRSEMLTVLENIRELNAKQGEWREALREAGSKSHVAGIVNDETRVKVLGDLWPWSSLGDVLGHFDTRLMYSSSNREDRLRAPNFNVELDRL
jgi:chromosome segregation ATPase